MDIWDFLGRTDIVFGLLATIFSGFAALKLRQQSKRLKELAKATPHMENFKEQVNYHAGVKTTNPKAFALSLIPRGESIKEAVKTFLNSQGWKMDVEELNMNGINNKADLEFFINELRKKRRLFDAQCVTELHLFVAGPVMAAALTGAMFDNWIPVKLYQKPQPPPPNVYEYWGPLLK